MRPLGLALLIATSASASAADPPARTDRYGDPLPTGALMRLGTLRNRAPITGFGITNDGTVVTVGPGADVRRWRATEDKSSEPAVLPLTGETSNINYPQVSPDGKYVAACSTEKVFVWEALADAKAKPKQVAAFDLAHARLIRFSPAGSTLAVVTEPWNKVPGAAFLCDLKTQTATGLGTGGSFESVTFSGDGKRLGVSEGYDFILWDTATGKQLTKYRTAGRMSGAFALNHAGDLVVWRSGFLIDKVGWRFADALTGKKRDGLTGPEGGTWVTFAPDDKALLIGDHSGIRLWDPVAGKLVRKFDGVASETYAFQRAPARFTPDGKVLVVQNGHALLRWDAATGKPLFPEQDIGHGGFVSGLGMSPDGKRVATRGMDERVCVWDAATGKQLWRTPAAQTGDPDLGFSPDGKFLCVGGPKLGEATKYDAETGKALLTFAVDPKEPQQAGVDSVRVSKDGKTVFALTGPNDAADPGIVTAWDAATGERVKSTRVPYSAAIGGVLSRDGQYVAFGDFGGKGVVAVAAPDRNLLADAKLPGFSFHPGRFSDDGQWLTLVNWDKNDGRPTYSAVLISTLTWRPVSTLRLADDGHAAVAPDGYTLAVAVGDALEFYDAATGKLLGRHRVPAGEWAKARFGHTHALRFTPDGTKLITGHMDTTALVWPVPARPAK